MAELPSGTVTFVFTDLAVSTRLWDQERDAMSAAMARHDAILREAVDAEGGHVVKGRGDGFHAVFQTADAAVRAAIAGQRSLARESWPVSEPLQVRIGIHTGVAEVRDGDYFGSAVNRAARLEGIAYGGQIVLSHVTEGLVRDELDDDVELVDLGEHRLRDLSRAERVFQVLATDLLDDFPPLRSVDAFPGNLPAQLSSFVGREQELDDVAELLGDNRLVTLTGVGGVGKTRLALRVAGEVLPQFPDGAWFAELATVRDPAAVVEAVATSLGVPSRSDAPILDTVTRFLRPKRALLVLDNCEHLLDAAAELVRALEGACPDLGVLATSREGLGIRGERLVAVPSLPASDSERLFAGRAEAAKHDFVLTDANVDAVREVCRRLDGVPLAIELAAARVSVLSPSQIAARLDQRFALLAGGERGAVERHATLRAAIDWSYDLLGPSERLLLARLTVFAGGCTLDGAEAVCAGGTIESSQVIELLSNLVARSLVTVDISDAEETWYRLYEIIRQYAEERLDPDDRVATRDRHARYYATWLASATEGLRGAQQAVWVARTERETENVRAAISWALDREDGQLAFDLLVAADVVPAQSLPIGRVLWITADRVAGLVRGTSTERVPRVLALAAWGAMIQGDFDRSTALLAEAMALDDGTDDRLVDTVLFVDTAVAFATGDVARAVEDNERQLSRARAAASVFDLAYLLAVLGVTHAVDGDVDTALVEAGEALELARRTGAPSVISLAEAALAFAMLSFDPDGARVRLRALVSAATLPTWSDLTVEATLSLMMACGTLLGERDVTLAVARRVLDEIPSTPVLRGTLEQAAAVLAPTAPEAAATLRGAADGAASGYPAFVQLRGDAAAIAAEAATPAYEAGRRMTQDEAIVFARTVVRDALADIESPEVL